MSEDDLFLELIGINLTGNANYFTYSPIISLIIQDLL